MRQVALFSGVSLALLAPLSAGAVDTANLRVTGTISPAVCVVGIIGSPEVSLGTINLSQFKPGEDLALPERTASLKIDCLHGAAQFRLKATDTGGTFPGAKIDQYSLGFNDQGGGVAKSNGYFTLSIDTAAMAAGKYVLKSTDNGAGKTWGDPATGLVSFDHDGEAFAFADSGDATAPANLPSLTVPLKIAAVLSRDPVVGEEVTLAGQATIEIFY